MRRRRGASLDSHLVRARLRVAPDGKRFLMLKPSTHAEATELHVILNWFDDGRARVSLPK